VIRHPTPFKAPPGCLGVVRGLIIAAGVTGMLAVALGATVFLFGLVS
jgi:hypothetical protein